MAPRSRDLIQVLGRLRAADGLRGPAVHDVVPRLRGAWHDVRHLHLRVAGIYGAPDVLDLRR
eukprot:66283-Pyramimonas_sp.AAC.1